MSDDWKGEHLIRSRRKPTPAIEENLSSKVARRRREITAMFYKGYTVKEMMLRLGLEDDKTVRNDLVRLGLKLTERSNVG